MRLVRALRGCKQRSLTVRKKAPTVSRRVRNAAVANAALVLGSKNWKKVIRDGGQRRKTNPKSLGSAFSLCRRAGIDAALVKADSFAQAHPPSKIKLNRKFKH